jgi:AcrR family transcriptional regulator
MTAVELDPAQHKSTTTSRRELIINAAVTMATDGGYAAVRMRVIAERAGIAVGTLYRYFPSKPHLLVSALTREFKRLDQEDDWATIADTPRQRLARLNSRLHGEWCTKPLLTEAVTCAFVFVDATTAAEAATVIEHMLARAVAGGDPTPPEHHVAAVIADIWLANMIAWIRQRVTTDEVCQRLDHAVRLLLAHEFQGPNT